MNFKTIYFIRTLIVTGLNVIRRTCIYIHDIKNIFLISKHQLVNTTDASETTSKPC